MEMFVPRDDEATNDLKRARKRPLEEAAVRDGFPDDVKVSRGGKTKGFRERFQVLIS